MGLFLYLEEALAKLEDNLTTMLRPSVDMLGYELVGIEFIRAGKHSTLRVYIDHQDGINVDNCAEVSHQVSAILDVEDPISTEYFLEVSSPGADRPLFTLEHYQTHVGEVVSLKTRMPLEGRRNFKGKLVAVEGETITVEVDGQDFRLVYDNIEKANIVPDFGEGRARQK